MRSPTFNYEEFLVEAARQSFISKGNLIWWLGGGGRVEGSRGPGRGQEGRSRKAGGLPKGGQWGLAC